MHHNPFANRGMILKEAEFVGRIRELDDIFPRIRTGNSVSIVGDRRIGKSSLLYHIYLTSPQRLGATYKVVYFNLHNPALKTPFDFAQNMLEELELPYDLEQLKSRPMVILGRCLKNCSQQPIILLDEFEEITQHRDLFNDDFFESLRFYCDNGNLTLVTASKKTLKALTDQGDLTSPLWNIFSILSLGEFAYDDLLDEVALFLTRLWKTPSKEEKSFLLAYSSTHPLVMQVVSYHLFQNRKLQFADRIITENIEKELQSYFRNREEQFSKWMRSRTPIFLQGLNWTTEYIGKQLNNIAPLTGLISIKGE